MEKDTSDSLLKTKIDTSSTPPARTTAFESPDVDPQTSHITHDVPVIPRLTPEVIGKAQAQTTEGLDPVKGDQQPVYAQADQDKSVMSYPDPTANQSGGSSLQEFMLEFTRDKQGIRDRLAQDRARDSKVQGWGDDEVPDLGNAYDQARWRFAQPYDRQANTGVLGSPGDPSDKAPGHTLNTMFEGMRSTIQALQSQFAAGIEGMLKILQAQLKSQTTAQFRTPAEDDLD